MSGPPVVLTRAVGDNARLGAMLEQRGVPWVEWPALAFVPIPVPRDALVGVSAIAFVSPAAIRMARGIRWPSVPRIAQGGGTAEAMIAARIRVDAIADPPDANGLAAAVIATVPPGVVALVRGDHGRDEVPAILGAAGYDVRVVTVYENREPPALARPRQAVRAIVYASPTAVRRMRAANPWLDAVPAVAIGPTTAAALGDPSRARVAATPSAEGLLAAILDVR